MKTETKKQRIVQALNETTRYIDRESARADDLRPVETQELLAIYVAHKAKLNNMLAELG